MTLTGVLKFSNQIKNAFRAFLILAMATGLLLSFSPNALAQDKEGKKKEQVGKKSAKSPKIKKDKNKDRSATGEEYQKRTNQSPPPRSTEGTRYSGKNKSKTTKAGTEGTRFSGKDNPKSIQSGTEGTRFSGRDQRKTVSGENSGTRFSGRDRRKTISTGSEGTGFSGNDRPKNIKGDDGTRFSGNDRPKNIKGDDGTRFSGNDRPKNIKGDDGTRFSGNDRPKNIKGDDGTRFSGNDRPKTISNGSDGTQYRGGTKAEISTNEGKTTIYGVRGYNNNGKGQRIKDLGPAKGTTFKGHQTKKITGPADGENYAGNLKSSKRIQGTPGTQHSGNLKGGPRVIRDYGGDYSGNLRVSKRAKKPEGTEYAGIVSPDISNEGGRTTIYGERGYNNHGNKVKIKDLGPAPGTTFKGHLKKTKKIVNWDGADFAGKMKVPTEAAKDRAFKKQSQEEQLFAGNFKIKKNKISDLHPSSQYRGGKTKNSLEHKERIRKRKIWWSKAQKNDDQPKHLKEKRKKPKYDPKERDIWND